MIADNPVCDMKSWPAGWGLSEGDDVSWARCLAAWGLDEDSARETSGNPVDRVVELAEQDIPVLHLVGTADLVVPLSENSAVMQRRMRQVGGSITVIERNGAGHHPHLLEDPSPIVDFVLQHTVEAQAFHQLRGGLPRFRTAAAAGAARVVFLGGSITANPGWARSVQGDLMRAHPEAEIDFEIAGVPSLDSSAHAFRIERDLLGKPAADLVILEAAVNDETNGRSMAEALRGVEGCVRRLKQAWPGTDILLVHFPTTAAVAGWSTGASRSTVLAHEQVAAHYDLPSVDLSAEFATRIARGEFGWQDYGGEHPSNFGQRIVWRSMQRCLRALGALPGPVPVADPSVPAGELPTPLDPWSYEGGVQLGLDACRPGDGWTLIPEWKPESGVGARPGFVLCPTLEATAPGARLELDFEGRAVGLQVIAGPDAGRLRWSVDGSAPKDLDLFTRWSGQLHLPWFHVLTTGLGPGPHQLVIETAKDENQRSAARIQAFLVDQPVAASGSQGGDD